MTGSTPAPQSPLPLAARFAFYLSIATCGLMFPLVFVGAGVTSRDFGMAYLDWPTSAGHIVNPPGWQKTPSTFWEHGHRLLGWSVGILATGTLIMGLLRGGALRTLACAVWFAVLVQGILGGLRVREVSRLFALIHGIWGQLVFCLACAAVLVASHRWGQRGGRLLVPSVRTLRRACLATNVALFVQLVLGAIRRHFGGDHALIAHLLWAVVVGLLVGWVVLWVIGQHPGRDLVEVLGWLLGGLMTLQLALGGLAWAMTASGSLAPSAWVWAVPTAHVAVGALLLACSVLMTICSFRFLEAPAMNTGSAEGAQWAVP